jgi:ornithine carbamoyltransferase
MLFNKPSLRTRISFETGMTQLGGHAIYYHLAGQPLGVKESYYDTGMVISRMVDVCMARLQSRDELNGLADASSIPIINALGKCVCMCVCVFACLRVCMCVRINACPTVYTNHNLTHSL